MENRKLVKFTVPALLLGLFANSPQALAYGIETHAALTRNIFDFYNQRFPDKKISEGLKNFLMDGSRHEDSLPRWMNHFYDPIYDRGLESIYGNGYKSKEWAVDKDKQNETKYKITTALASLLTVVQQRKISALTTETDFTWERAVRFWVNGDKEKAMYLLGHILHLVEDASVPDHTRNDGHPGFGEDYSPYENFTGNQEIYNKDFSAKLTGRGPVRFTTLAEYFEEIAKYSNNNFYSEESIGIQSGYSKPEPINFELLNGFYYGVFRDEKGDEYFLALKKSRKGSLVFSNEFDMTVDDALIMGDYWDRLSVKSIQYGAGVVDLFFKEVERAEKDPNFVREEKTMLGQLFGTIYDFYGDVKTALANAWQLIVGTNDPAITEITVNNTETSLAPSAAPVPTATTQNTAPATQSPVPSQSPAPQTTTAPTGTQEAQTTPTAPAPKQCSFAQGGSPSHQGAIINEVAWMGMAADANDEWIELKNTSSATLDISGWQLLDQGEQIKVTFPSGTKIGAGGYLFLERTDDSSVPGVSADLIYSGALSNTNEGLRLFNSQCTLIDEVLAAPDWPAGNATDRLTMERDLSGFGWHTATVPGGTPKKENSLPAPAPQTSGTTNGGSSSSASATTSTNTPPPPEPPPSSTISASTHVVISEVQITGGPGQTTNDFIELYNPTDAPFNLKGHRLVKRTKTGTADTSLKSWTSDVFVPAKGFYLWANSGYETINVVPDAATTGSIADDNGIALREGSADTGTIIDSVAWGDAQNIFSEGTKFPTNLGANQSIERKAVSGGACVSPQGTGEFLGNGCDMDNASDLEIREIPLPQNSQNLPEPRAAAAVQNPSVSYSSSTMELVFNWESSADAAGATSTVAYEVQEYNSPGVVIFNATSTNEFRKPIDEVGRDYNFSLQTIDRDGLGSATTTLNISIPTFFSNIAWYTDPAATSTYQLEMRFDRYPFVPDVFSIRGPEQKIVVAYLNENASKVPSNLATRTWLQLDAATNPALWKYGNCAGGNAPTPLLFLPDNPNWCSSTSGDVRLNALPLPFNNLGVPEDLLLRIRLEPRAEPFAPTDYLTFAFYDGADSGGGNQGYSLTAVDKTKYYFNTEPPAREPPTAPADLELSATHDDFTGISGILAPFAPSTDPDSLDGSLRYEWRKGDEAWQGLNLVGGPDPAKRYGAFSLPMGGTYAISIRSIDETGLVSSAAASEITLPAAPPGCPRAEGNSYYTIDCIRLKDGLVEIRWRLLGAPAGGPFGIIPYLSGTEPSASKALHKNPDPDGNGYMPESTATDGSWQCNSSITLFSQYELGKQYQTFFRSISGVAASDITAGATFKFAIFRAAAFRCGVDILFDWTDPMEYVVSVP